MKLRFLSLAVATLLVAATFGCHGKTTTTPDAPEMSATTTEAGTASTPPATQPATTDPNVTVTRESTGQDIFAWPCGKRDIDPNTAIETTFTVKTGSQPFNSGPLVVYARFDGVCAPTQDNPLDGVASLDHDRKFAPNTTTKVKLTFDSAKAVQLAKEKLDSDGCVVFQVDDLALNVGVLLKACVSVPPPPPSKACRDYKQPPSPEFGGSLALINETDTQVTVTAGSVSPSGGIFSNSALGPQDRLDYPNTLIFNTDYKLVVPYGPRELKCTAEFHHPYSIEVPSKPCPEINQWTLKNKRQDSTVYTIVVVTDPQHPGDSIVKSFDLAGGQSAPPFSGFDNTTLWAFFKVPHNGPTLYRYYMHDSSTHARNACEADGGTWLDGSHHECDTPNLHGHSYDGYKWSNYYGGDDATYQGSTHGETTYSYDQATQHGTTSGSCGAHDDAHGVGALWLGDASLTVSCVCPVQQSRR